ncbi:MAG: beta-propeller fold lactonase family protein [Betaproteobacteria bacterium]
MNHSLPKLPMAHPGAALTLAFSLALTACGGGGDGSGGGAVSYTLGGTITSLTGSGLLLQSNGETLNVAPNATAFTFANALSGSYDVTIAAQPSGQTCTVANGSGSAAGANVTSVAVACRSYVLYVADATDGSISQYTSGSDGQLTPLGSYGTSFQPNSIVVSSDGLHAWASYQDDNGIANLNIGATGLLQAHGGSTRALSTQDALGLAVDGKSLYAAEYGATQVSQFTIATSGLASASPTTSVATGVNPSALVSMADGAHLYVANASADTISGFALNASGTPTALATAATSTTAYGSSPRGLAVNPNSGTLYVTLSASAKVIQYTVDPTTGVLAFAHSAATGATPRGITVTPSGAYAYVANYGSGTVSQYTLAGGSITPLSTPTVTVGTHPTAIAISPDGEFAYVTNFGSNTISQFSIGAGGLLTPLAAPTVDSNGAGPIAAAIR